MVQVEKVAISSRLASTPCILTTSQYGYSANMERIMKSQAFADPSRAQHLVSKKTMEINPRHPIIVELLARVNENKDVRGELWVWVSSFTVRHNPATRCGQP